MKKFIYLLLASCFLGIGTISAQDASASDKARDAADAAYKAKDYATALTNYETFLKADNYQDASRIFTACHSASMVKNNEATVKFADMAIEKGSNTQNAYVLKAQALRNMDKADDFKSTVEAGLKAFPGNKNLETLSYGYFMKEGQDADKGGDLAKAEANYKNVLELVSDNTRKGNALLSIGQMYYTKGANTLNAARPLAATDADKYAAEKAKADVDLKKAKEYLDQAIALVPDNATVKKILESINGLL
jgi:pilus assembly protein Flp/PilA